MHPRVIHFRTLFRRGALVTATLLPCLPLAAAPNERSIASSPEAVGTVEVEGAVREESAQFLTRFALPVWQPNNAATLLQAAGSKGEQSAGFFSGGVIQRFRPLGGDWVLGVHGFYEAARTTGGFGFQQIDFGLEIAHSRHIVRAHAWVPVTGGQTRRTPDEEYKESPSRGFDVEYEIDLPSPGWELQPRLAVGYYYITASDTLSAKESGFKARAELQYRWLTTALEWREDDRINGGNWLGTLRVSLPLGRQVTQDRTAARMSVPIRHDLWPRTFGKESYVGSKATALPPAARPAPAPAAAPVEDCCGGAPSVLIYD
jgi:hypothetical protein